MVDGLAALERRFAAIPLAVRTEVKLAMEKAAPQVVADMQRFAPKDQGDLAASIGWTWGEAPAGSLVIGSAGGGSAYGGLRVTFYAGNDRTQVYNSRGIAFQNARLQEFGTKAMRANPFFYPVWRIWRRRIKSRITAAMKRGIKRLV